MDVSWPYNTQKERNQTQKNCATSLLIKSSGPCVGHKSLYWVWGESKYSVFDPCVDCGCLSMVLYVCWCRVHVKHERTKDTLGVRVHFEFPIMASQRANDKACHKFQERVGCREISSMWSTRHPALRIICPLTVCEHTSRRFSWLSSIQPQWDTNGFKDAFDFREHFRRPTEGKHNIVRAVPQSVIAIRTRREHIHFAP